MHNTSGFRGHADSHSPYFDLRDAEGLATEAKNAVMFGFQAKAAIHPNQVRTINDALTPSQENVEHARAVLAANATGVGTVDGHMIDEAVARKARRVLAAARNDTDCDP